MTKNYCLLFLILCFGAGSVILTCHAVIIGAAVIPDQGEDVTEAPVGVVEESEDENPEELANDEPQVRAQSEDGLLELHELYTKMISWEKGDQGPPGDKGDTGIKGEKGKMGDDGDKGTQGTAGTVGEQGRKGDEGKKGAQGGVGRPGDIGDKGDPGVGGAKGDKGEAGIEGTQGMEGDIGPKGEIGDAGAAGAKGPKGAKGDRGPVGADGAKGDTGNAGPKGDSGAKGDAGDTGATGPKGDTGPTGDPGKPGIISKEYIASIPFTTGGEWNLWDYCDDREFVKGYAIQLSNVENGNDNGVCGLRLYCEKKGNSDLRNEQRYYTMEETGPSGTYNHIHMCPGSGYANGIQLKQVRAADAAKAPFIAMASLKLLCSSGGNIADMTTDNVQDYPEVGIWTREQYCPVAYGICGFQVQVAKHQPTCFNK